MNVERYYNKAHLRLPEEKEDRKVQIEKFEVLVKLAEEMMKTNSEGLEYFEITSQISSPLREDIVEESIDRELVFANTKHREYGYFKLDNTMED